MRLSGTIFILSFVTALTGAKLDRVDLEMPRSFDAFRIVTENIRIDGNLSDQAWKEVDFAADFVQRDPLEGETPTERTEFAVLYDDEYIYVGIKAYDSQPEDIRSILSRRDEETPSDWVHVSFDSYNDHRTAFEFWLNPQGIKRDVRRYDDENMDVNWDAIWEGRAAIQYDGWTAEFRIPLRELRFSNGDNQSWGLQVYRHISRKNEDDYWTYWSKGEGGWVRHYGRLINLDNIPRQRRIYFSPYTTGQYATASSYITPVHPESYNLSRNLGADLKVGLTNNFTLDLTLNPDFGQVEADPAELNISAFESYFPEKRPFFVEGSNIFQYSLGFGDNPMSGNSLFYTRRIGRSPQYSPDTEEGYVDIPMATTILGAGKLSGKTSSGWSIGLLDAVTAEEQATIEYADQSSTRETVEPFTNYFVSRVQKDFRNGKTNIGGIVTATNRRLEEGHLKYLHRDAYSAGFDISHIFADDTYQFSTTIGVSSVNGSREAILNTQLSSNHRFQRPGAPHLQVDSSATSLSGFAGNAILSKIKGENWRGALGSWFYSPGFNANDVGFNRNVDNSMQFIWLQYREDDPGKVIRRWRLNFNGWTGFTFAWLEEMTNIGGNFNGGLTFMNYWSVNGGINANGRGLNTVALWGGPAMAQDPSYNVWLSVNSDYRKALSAGTNGNMGIAPESGVQWRNTGARLTWRPTNYFALTASTRWSQMHDTWANWGGFGPITDEQTGVEHYIMATMDRNTLSTTLRFDLTLTPTLSIQYYGSPFVTAATFTEDKLVLEDHTRADRFDDRFHTFTAEEQDYDGDPYTYDTDGDGVTNFEIENRDFNYKQFNSNLVLRWEYQTGSAIYFVWSQNISESLDIGGFELAQDLRQLFKADSENFFLIKASYLLNI